MLEAYGIQDVASQFVRLRGRLPQRLRSPRCFFLNLYFCPPFFLMEACGIDSLILLQLPCSSLISLLLLQLQWQKSFAQGAAEINHSSKTEKRT